MPLPTTLALPANDQSKLLLDNLFGLNWSEWGTGSLAGADGTSTNLMFQIFETFNAIALAVIAGLFIFTTVIAVVGTAHEGSPMGKKYNAFWMPVRFVLSVASLAPIFKGLSLFQVVILACIGGSITLSNHVYALGNNFYVKHTGEFEVQPLTYNEHLRNVNNDIVKSLALQAYLKNERKAEQLQIGSPDNWKYVHHTKWLGTFKKSTGYWRYTFSGPKGRSYDTIGQIKVHCLSENEQAMKLCQKKKEAITNTIRTLMIPASFLATPKWSIDHITPNFLDTSEKQLSADTLTAVNEYINTDQNFKHKLTSYKEVTDDFGWVVAGATYWAISWINQETKSLMNANIESSVYLNAEDDFHRYVHRLPEGGAIVKRVNNYVASAYSPQKEVADLNTYSESEGFWSGIFGYLTEHLGEISIPYIVTKLTTNDPVMFLSDVGNIMVNIATGLFTFIFTVSVFSGPFGQAAASFGLFAMCTPLFLYGIYLAFWLPAIPFIRWMAGILGWLILVIEALIAAPLWVVAHALPDGDGFAGNHARRGYFLLFAIVIRPSLMVAGFFIAVTMINAIGMFLGTIFSFVFNTLPDYADGLIGTICFIVIIGTIIVMSANKIFGLITWLPDNVSNWIGQQLHSLGEDRDIDVAKGAFSSSTNVLTSVKPGASQVGLKFGFRRNANSPNEDKLK